MKNRLAIFLLLAVVFSISAPMFAHHGGATLYTDRTVTLKGTVVKWFWSNPHCLLTLDVKGDDGQTVQWIAETQAPNSIYGSGYRKDSFKPGDMVTVVLQPTKNGKPNGRLSSAILADGTKLGGGGADEGGEGGGRGGRGGRGASY
jgi:hypothetical protein